MKTHNSALAVLTLFVVACATPAQFESHMSSWMGQSVETMIGGWGEPVAIVDIPNGNVVYVYQYGRLGDAKAVDPIRAAGRAQHACRIGIEVENNVAKSYEYNGNYRTCAGNIPSPHP